MHRIHVLAVALAALALPVRAGIVYKEEVAGGSACSAPDNFITSTAHLYFHADTDWVDDADPDDEGSGTDQALEHTSGVAEGDLVDCAAGCAPGTPTGIVRLALTGTEYAVTASGVNIFKGAQFGDATACAWLNVTSVDFDGVWGVDDGGAYNYKLNIDQNDADADGSVMYAAFDGSGIANQSTADGLVADATWAFVCTSIDGNGGADGTQNRRIYVNGALVAGPTDTDDESDTAVTYSGLRVRVPSFGAGTDMEFEVSQFATWHSRLTDAEINEMFCCGMNGEANPTDRESISAGDTSCSSF